MQAHMDRGKLFCKPYIYNLTVLLILDLEREEITLPVIQHSISNLDAGLYVLVL